jgi:hypothetical protein
MPVEKDPEGPEVPITQGPSFGLLYIHSIDHSEGLEKSFCQKILLLARSLESPSLTGVLIVFFSNVICPKTITEINIKVAKIVVLFISVKFS